MRQYGLEEAAGLETDTCQGNKTAFGPGESCFDHRFVASFLPHLLFFSHCLLRLQDLWCRDLFIHTVFVWES